LVSGISSVYSGISSVQSLLALGQCRSKLVAVQAWSVVVAVYSGGASIVVV
jgi:hypothetical protein